MTTLLYLMACLMSPAPLMNLAESRVEYFSLISTIMKPGGLFLIDSPNWWGLKEEVMLAGDKGTATLYHRH